MSYSYVYGQTSYLKKKKNCNSRILRIKKQGIESKNKYNNNKIFVKKINVDFKFILSNVEQQYLNFFFCVSRRVGLAQFIYLFKFTLVITFSVPHTYTVKIL